ncbi:MAG TPA: rhomboid family intramembrane serine protease, partial [Candidatus Polarisedimenticolia bacterium]|nr:rhomboid family intramembrane serine protease [Candidatus Polarisedimenticolia bacterium]
AFAASALFSPQVPAVGASGALFGLMGFGITFGRFRGGRTGRMISDQLLRWAVYGVIMFFMPGIDNIAHIGGLIAGGTLGLMVAPGEPRSRAGEIALRWLSGGALLATLASFAMVALTYERHLEILRLRGWL